MKNLLPFLFLLAYTSGICQQPNFELRSAYARTIKNEELKAPKNMADIIPYYPHSWITDYESTQISVKKQGNTQTAAGKNDALNAGQIALLTSATIGDEITVLIDYKTKNSTTNIPENKKMNIVYTVVPVIEATNSIGMKQLRQYISDNAISKLPEIKKDEIVGVTIQFVVNENGEVTETNLKKSSGRQEMDKLLLDTINNMPKWTPAQNSQGQTFKQSFVFVMNINGDC